ncbi:hypothetical protein [Thiomonas sp. FB-6]|uniref:hypothetical protein n=1 Tax=Thiomonas sp. FB-6 TaxID=1158291 RepID=UPI0009DC1A7B|nr:hypothetical protein [Thiomonas sp. FB-6]
MRAAIWKAKFDGHLKKQALQYIETFKESLRRAAQREKVVAADELYDAASLLQATTGVLYAVRQPGDGGLYKMHLTANLFSSFSLNTLSTKLADGALKAWPTLFAKDALIHVRIHLERMRGVDVEGAIIGTGEELEQCATNLLKTELNRLESPWSSSAVKSFAIPLAEQDKSQRKSASNNAVVQYLLGRRLRIGGRTTTLESLCAARLNEAERSLYTAHYELARRGVRYSKPGIFVLETRLDGRAERNFVAGPFKRSWREALGKTVAFDLAGKTYKAADIKSNIPEARVMLELCMR